MPRPDMNQTRLIEENVLGEDARFHHIGLVVKSIEHAAPAGVAIYEDPLQDVRVAFVDLHGITIEYIEPSSENSPVANSLKKKQKLVHMCFCVADLENTIEQARQNGFGLVAAPVPAVAFGGREIAWISSRVYGLVELLSETPPTPEADAESE
jgi:methylmalonyl-CoA/ethylmalonyl-CoA epimerase